MAEQAVRLIFELREGEMTLVQQTPVDVAVDNLGVVPAAPAALAVETRDDAEQPVERVPVPGHLATREVFAPAEEGGGIARVESTEPVVFTVVVPV